MKNNNDKNLFDFKNFNNFLDFYCKKHKKNIFYLSEKKNEQINYSKLSIIVNNFGYFLKSLRIKKNDKILVILDNSRSLVIIFLSIIYNQNIFIPVNPNSSSNEINYIIKKTKPKLVIIDNDLKKRFKLSNLNKIFYLNHKNFINIILKHRVKKIKIDKLNNNQISQILFTSGSTGNPKGVVLTHRSMLANLYGLYKAFNIEGHNAKFLSATPLYHNNGQFIPTLIPIILGGSTISISPDTSLINFWPVVKKYKINYSSVMATHINYFNTINLKTKHNLKSLFCGGAKLDKKSQNLFEKKFNIKVLCNYGLTETSSIAATQTMNNKKNNGSVGLPLFNNQIKISKSKKNIGEILIKGENIFKEYLNDKKLTKSKFENFWFKTGDLGYLDKDNNLYIKDRIDNMIIVSGENIYPSEIENFIYKFKDIKLGIVTSVPDKLTQNKIILVYESEKDINYKDFFNYIKHKISRFKIPKEIINIKSIGLNQIPKAPNKKILRKKLREEIIKYYLNK